MSIPLPPIYHLFHDNNNNDNENDDNISVNERDDEKNRSNNNIHIHDLYLDAEERYEIFMVKAAERPHLLHYSEKEETNNNRNGDRSSSDDKEALKYNHYHESKESNIGDDDNHKDGMVTLPPPLIDGCDIPGWRKEQLVTSSFLTVSKSTISKNTIEFLLNIGPSSTMFRKESQWPNLNKILQQQQQQQQHDTKTKIITSTTTIIESKWDVMKKKLNHEPNDCENAIIVDYDEYCQLVETKMENDDSSSEGSSRPKMATKFAMEFEQPNIPAKILGATKHWKCMAQQQQQPPISNNNIAVLKEEQNLKYDSSWTFENLVKRYGHVNWRFSDTHGEMMSLKTYAKYIYNIEGLLDDSPLGIYDAEFGDDDSPTSDMVHEYDVPKCFSPDIFDIATKTKRHDDDDNDDESENDDNDVRPPWRWILIGPERSGTGLHIDPLWTNAWVTVIQGKKRWLLFPPNTPQDQIGMSDDHPQINSATWFHHYYDKVKSSEWPKEYKPVEVLQLPGETVFVPNGWPHIVLNLETTVAVTHNYASEFGPFERMWEEVAQDEPEFAERWLDGMKKHRYDLYQRVLSLSSSKTIVQQQPLPTTKE